MVFCEERRGPKFANGKGLDLEMQGWKFISLHAAIGFGSMLCGTLNPKGNRFIRQPYTSRLQCVSF